MKRLVCLILALAMLAALLPTTLAESAHTVECREYPIYVGNMDDVTDDYPFYFMDGVDDLPWVELEMWGDVMNLMFHTYLNDEGCRFTYSLKGSVGKLSRENGYYMEVDFDADTITFNDYNGFLHISADTPLLDMLSDTGFDEAGEAALFQRNNQASYDRYGDMIVLNLADYDIDMILQDGKGYLPLQTVGDFLLATSTGLCTYFNGKAVMFGNEDLFFDRNASALTPLGEYFYSAEPAQRSEALAAYGYNELCLMLDKLYGLKAIHNIESFQKLFWQIGFDEVFASADPHEADIALFNFIDMYLDDLHSEFGLYSWMAGALDVDPAFGPSDLRYGAHATRYRKLRTELQGEYDYSYKEVGNTAYITFDKFISNYYGSTYYKAESLDDIPMDTIGLMIYAYAQIYRDDSPIENVVFDLSNNSGGDVDAALFVMAFVLGDAELSIYDRFTGAQSTMLYRGDLNLDREFDWRDTLDDKNVFCLISPVSFSCGNLVPAAFKASQLVTLIGRTSGGGTCTVQNMSTAWGTSFTLSGPMSMSFRKNGSFYDIDQGVEPDIYLSNLKTFYDREALTRLINELD